MLALDLLVAEIDAAPACHEQAKISDVLQGNNVRFPTF
jgi:hypothetical protein